MSQIQSFGLIEQAIVNGHFVLRSGLHSSVYINKDSLYTNPFILTILANDIADHFRENKEVDVVVGPAFGGILLAHAVAKALWTSTKQIYSVFAEKDANNGFIFKRGYDKIIQNKNILIVEDILTTGQSAKKVVELCRNFDANVIGAGVLCNRKNVSAEKLGNIPELYAIQTIPLETWTKSDCPLCKKNTPINKELGQGK